MVLGTLMALVGRHLIMQRRVFWFAKKNLESMLDESVLSAANKMGGFVLDKGPEVSLSPEKNGYRYLFHQNWS